MTDDERVEDHYDEFRDVSHGEVIHLLQDAGDDGGARGVDQRLFGGVAQQLVMSGHHAIGEKATRILEFGLGFALEHGGQGLQRQLRSHLAFRVTAHAVGDGKEA